MIKQELSDLLLLNETQERGPLDLHGLALAVVQGQHEVEEVGLPQVRGRLLLKVSPGQTHSTAGEAQERAGRTHISLYHYIKTIYCILSSTLQIHQNNLMKWDLYSLSM